MSRSWDEKCMDAASAAVNILLAHKTSCNFAKQKLVSICYHPHCCGSLHHFLFLLPEPLHNWATFYHHNHNKFLEKVEALEKPAIFISLQKCSHHGCRLPLTQIDITAALRKKRAWNMHAKTTNNPTFSAAAAEKINQRVVMCASIHHVQRRLTPPTFSLLYKQMQTCVSKNISSSLRIPSCSNHENTTPPDQPPLYCLPWKMR